MELSLEQVKNVLLAYRQEHVIERLEQLPVQAQQKLAAQIAQIEFETLFRAIDRHKDPRAVGTLGTERIAPIAYENWNDYDEKQQQAYGELGWALLRSGKVGAVVVAGGQGSRLGSSGPKGTIDIGLPSGKSLFQLQAERLLYLSKRAGRNIPWYVMTSPVNHKATETFFQAADYFGYTAADIVFFSQQTMPVLDHDGKLLFAEEGKLLLAPSGPGECFASMRKSGVIEDMKQRGVEWLFYYNVDNALIKVADPDFLGVAAAHANPIATKVIEKHDPNEKIGIVCTKNGQPAVVEYTEISEDVKRARSKDGQLEYHLGNISIHAFQLDFIEQHADSDLVYHVASKRMEYIDDKGVRVQPAEPNAYKLERFIFDLFPMASGLTVLKTERDEQFAPVKNRSGEDSPQTARELVLRLHSKWLKAAGIAVQEGKLDQIEISPLQSYAGEGLLERKFMERP
ncbi:UDPGP type 1 family protein [Paenibacillus sinopodophylli]|uniref:UDPGP type 1 family protein n=1 Tax=Paenibacillus sinopodophylli TaxID=1837342 RepID=UPI00110D2159|nr:UDPGP type 1 family protein [Paenibacillus sinopodophylli]